MPTEARRHGTEDGFPLSCDKAVVDYEEEGSVQNVCREVKRHASSEREVPYGVDCVFRQCCLDREAAAQQLAKDFQIIEHKSMQSLDLQTAFL